jgi:MoaA/NifB/PqqE/SkfB family radical SAM enzyme
MKDIYPKYFTIDLILNRCNNKCRHCYSQIPESTPQPSYENIVLLLDKINESTLPEFIMSPWCLMQEPLLIRNIDKLISYINQKWPKCKSNDHLASNLSAISHNPEILNKLHQVGIRSFQFSFYGTEEVHDYFAGRKGAYKDIKKAIPLLLEKDFKPTPIIWLHSKIGPSLPSLLSLFKEFGFELPLNKLPAKLVEPVGNQVKHPEDIPTYEDLIDYKDILPENIFSYTEGNICKRITESAVSGQPNNNSCDLNNLTCSYTVFPNGDIYHFWTPIHPLFKLGNVLYDCMDEIHKSYFNSESQGHIILNNLGTVQLVRELGNLKSNKLYSSPESLVYYYKMEKLGFK